MEYRKYQALRTMARNLVDEANKTEKFIVAARFFFSSDYRFNTIAEIVINGDCSDDIISSCNTYYPPDVLGESIAAKGFYPLSELKKYIRQGKANVHLMKNGYCTID